MHQLKNKFVVLLLYFSFLQEGSDFSKTYMLVSNLICGIANSVIIICYIAKLSERNCLCLGMVSIGILHLLSLSLICTNLCHL